MSDFFNLNPLVDQLIRQSPVLLVYVIGMALALRNWQRIPTVGMLVLCGAGILFASSVGGTIVFQIVVRLHREWGWTPDRLNGVFMAVGIINAVVHAIGIALLLAAAFSGRNRFDEESAGQS